MTGKVLCAVAYGGMPRRAEVIDDFDLEREALKGVTPPTEDYV